MTLRIDVISLMPGLVQAVGDYGVTGRAMERRLLSLHLWNPRDYATDTHKTVDDRAYGGGPGMVMKPEPLSAAMQAAINAAELPAKRIYLSPQGRRFDHQAALDFSKQHRLILLAGRYEGIDERFIQTEIDEEWSLGDYVLSGGELGAMVIIDAVARLLPGALGDAESAAQDSFAEVLLDHPHFTRPENYLGNRVPEVLLSGDHAAIARWRRMQALGRTEERRPDLLEKLDLDATDRALLAEYRQATNNLQTGK